MLRARCIPHQQSSLHFCIPISHRSSTNSSHPRWRTFFTYSFPHSVSSCLLSPLSIFLNGFPIRLGRGNIAREFPTETICGPAQNLFVPRNEFRSPLVSYDAANLWTALSREMKFTAREPNICGMVRISCPTEFISWDSKYRRWLKIRFGRDMWAMNFILWNRDFHVSPQISFEGTCICGCSETNFVESL